jgi:hypothetical protein
MAEWSIALPFVKKKAIEQGGEFLEPEVWRKENRD